VGEIDDLWEEPMSRRAWLRLFYLSFAAALVAVALPADAELSVGIGEIEKPTRKASAILNSALSTFHLMLAALDRKNTDDAAKLLTEAIHGVFDAANAYQEALGKADNHTLTPIGRDQQEADDVADFWAQWTAYKIEETPSQRSVLAAAVRLVTGFGGRLKAANIRRLEADLRSQQALAASAIELQAFLNSATTVLTIG
jgi:hypothetical protein